MTKPTFVKIDWSELGARRAADVYQRVRYAASVIDPRSRMRAEYRNRVRVGYTVWLRDAEAVALLHRCALAALAGLPLGPLLGAAS